MSFQVSLGNCQGFSIPDGGGKFIPPARNGEWKRSGEWFWASLWWYHEASLTSRSQTSEGDVDCHQWVEVGGSEPVAVLYASISVLNWMRAATGSQCKEIKRGVTWALLGPSNLIVHSESSVKVWLCMMEVQLDFSSLEMTRAWTRSCAACSVRKGLIFLMLCKANLQDQAVFAM